MEETKTNQAIIVALKNVRKHPNADRLQLATVCGSQIVVGLDVKEGDLGIYFDSNLQLSKEFAQANDLIRRKDADGKPAGGMFAENRKVKTQTFRGEKSDGFWTPVESLKAIGFLAVDELEEGMEFDELGGVPICNKFIAKFEKTGGGGGGAKAGKARKSSIMFVEHYDTPILARNLHKINKKGLITLTEKLHGTSQRYGRVQVQKVMPKGILALLLRLGQWLANLAGFKIEKHEWVYLNGTRRVVLDSDEKRNTGFHDDSLREIAIKNMKGQLKKGETLYFEVVGYEPSGKSIMPIVDTTLLKNKDFTKKFANMEDGRGMVYSYGQALGTSEVYVYRITMTNEDGIAIELPWSDVVARCSELGVKTVPVLAQFNNYDELVRHACVNDANCDGRTNIDDRDKDDLVINYLENLGSGASVLDSTHIKEGIGFRVDEGLVHTTFKHKTFDFKVLEGIVKDAGIVDMEEMASMGEELAEEV
jgi:hypothetical protein